jgi:hypothetical protein
MAAKKIEFSAKNVKAFSTWLKKFVSIDQSLLLEIDENESLFIAKTYNEERSVVKYSKIKFDEAGLTVKKSKDPQRVKVGIYNIARLMKVMDQFGSEEFSFTVNYDEVTGDNSTEFAGLNLVLKNKSLKITVDCTSLNIFKYISDELFVDRIAALDDVVAKFELSSENIEKVNSLCSLDSEYKFMEFKNAANVYVSGKTFDLLIGENPGEHDGSEQTINVFKEQFESIDVENYNVKMGDDRLVFSSHDLNTTTVISMVEKD